MRTFIFAAAAALPFASVVSLTPVAHAGPQDWSGDSPTGGMMTHEDGSNGFPVHAESHPDPGGYARMTAANGCVEAWYNQTNDNNGTQRPGFLSGFFRIHVISGEGPGCRDGEYAHVMIRDQGGGKKQMTVDEANPMVASWVMYNSG